MIQLPAIVNQDNRLKYAMIGLISFLGLYAINNHIQVFEPRTLPMTAIDRAFPFIPGTFWVYIIDYVLLFFVFYVAKQKENLNRLFYGFMFINVVSNTIFLIYPTTYPRIAYQADLYQGVTSTLFAYFWKYLDMPFNCFPSLHVSGAFLSCSLFLHEHKKWFPFFLLLAILISISTMTTKQHYFADIVGGFVVASFSYFIFFRSAKYVEN